MVVVQKSAESWASLDFTLELSDFGSWFYQLVVE